MSHHRLEYGRRLRKVTRLLKWELCATLRVDTCDADMLLAIPVRSYFKNKIKKAEILCLYHPYIQFAFHWGSFTLHLVYFEAMKVHIFIIPTFLVLSWIYLLFAYLETIEILRKSHELHVKEEFNVYKALKTEPNNLLNDDLINCRSNILLLAR